MERIDLALNILGFFELDDSGVIRYLSTVGRPADSGTSLIGTNFFEIAGLRNGDELQRHFRRFVESHEAADSFPFDCLLDDNVLHTKVSLTRAFQTDYFPPEGIVMLSIRECTQ
jgi:hypothetical protein